MKKKDARHLPYIKWFPTDWRADPRLRMCGLAARGLWIELIGYMHEGEPYGHLTINGVSPALNDIAALVGRPVSEVRKALAELEKHQVYSTDDAGRMHSRRMVRDKAKAEQDHKNGKGGGNPELMGKDKDGVNPPDKTHIPEARDQKPEREDAADAAPTYAFESGVIRLNQRDFDQWREAYSHLDLAAELLSLAEWASQQRSWFNAVKGALAKRNRETKTARDSRVGEAEFKWNGQEGVI